MNSVQKKLNLKFFCTEFVILLPLPPKHQKDLFVDIMRKNRTPMVNGMFFQRCLLTFSRKVLKSGWSEQDVRDRRPATWMSPRAVPVRIRTATHFSLENSHPETLHRGRMFRSPWAFVEVNIKKIYVNIPVFTASTSYFLSRAVFH